MNCRTPFGTILNNGENVTVNGMTCTCSLDNWWNNEKLDDCISWDCAYGPDAECSGSWTTPPLPTTITPSPITTTPPPTTTTPPPTTRKRRSPEERERWRKIRRLKKKLSKFRHTLPIKEKRKLKRRLRRLQSQG